MAYLGDIKIRPKIIPSQDLRTRNLRTDLITLIEIHNNLSREDLIEEVVGPKRVENYSEAEIDDTLKYLKNNGKLILKKNRYYLSE